MQQGTINVRAGCRPDKTSVSDRACALKKTLATTKQKMKKEEEEEEEEEEDMHKGH